MKFIIEIELGNDAVQTYEHIVALLSSTIRRIEAGAGLMNAVLPKDGDGGKIRDLNGNAVGKWEVTNHDLVRDLESMDCAGN